MDPLSIVATSFSLAGAIAKVSITLTEFSRDFSASADDLSQISLELKALSTILDPITRVLSSGRQSPLPAPLTKEVDNTLHGCLSVVRQTEEKISKYQRDKAWTKTKWVLFGQGDVQKLRESLGFYKVALGIGLHTISIHTSQDIKDDTEHVRIKMDAVKINTDKILARMNSIRQTNPHPSKDSSIEQWIDEIALLSSYAESSYMETVADPADLTLRPPSRGMTPLEDVGLRTPIQLGEPSFEIGEIDCLSGQNDNEITPSSEDTQPTTVVITNDGCPSATNHSSVEELKVTRQAGITSKSEHDVVPPAARKSIEQQALNSPMVPRSIKPADLCFDRIEDMAQMIRRTMLLAQPDKDLILLSQARRRLLQPKQQKELDQTLADIGPETTADMIRDTIAKGGDPNGGRPRHVATLALVKALVQRKKECVCALLCGGADPNAIDDPALGYPVLFYAIENGNQHAVWWLVAAGASVNFPVLESSSKTFASKRLVTTPFLYAIKHLYSSPHNPVEVSQLRIDPVKDIQVRIVRFLLANGAGFDICELSHERVANEISALATSWYTVDRLVIWRVAKLLLRSMGNPPYKEITTNNLSILNPFNEAAAHGAGPLLTLLGTDLLPYCSTTYDPAGHSAIEYWSGAMAVAARSQAWECAKILAKPPYACQESLLRLIQEYMQRKNQDTFASKRFGSLSWSGFSRAAEMLLNDNGSDPFVQRHVRFKKQTFLGTSSPGLRLVSPLELVNTIATDKDRRPVRKLLLQKRITSATHMPVRPPRAQSTFKEFK
ncbi:hypothetical protein AK830_g6831 [Neonectria ditissima]|uniref:Azaphilone pigments biosynthesis cluster protein L N-terminal domain-containing protein n=1 Tax=Neonectria ditissima TaxID=78410 RepID=A0A0P7AZ00_9HYPO|nr:hypothetical protein AK830_g6831 [Neonectria ditissima]